MIDQLKRYEEQLEGREEIMDRFNVALNEWEEKFEG
jgi:dTDP-4-amino-4,6-dideoxygalactose transaminase